MTKSPTAEQILFTVLDSINGIVATKKARSPLAQNVILSPALVDEIAKTVSQSVLFLLEGEEDTVDMKE